MELVQSVLIQYTKILAYHKRCIWLLNHFLARMVMIASARKGKVEMMIFIFRLMTPIKNMKSNSMPVSPIPVKVTALPGSG